MVSSFLRSRVQHLIGVGMVPGLLLAACGQGEELAEPDDTSALEILTLTSGGGSDPDGYAVRVDDGPEFPIGSLDTLLRTGLVAGDYRVALSGLVQECRVQGANPRLVALEPRRTARVEFGVTCVVPSATGSVEVTVTTAGSDLDPDGYVVSVDPAFTDTVSANGTATIVGVPVGQRGVLLGGIAANCAARGSAQQIVTVQEGQTTPVVFEVTCTPRPPGRLLFSRARAPTSSSFLVTQEADGTSLGSPLSDEIAVARAPAYSNDGGRIAYVGVLSGTVAVPHIITMNSDGSEAVAWEDCTASASRPVFSPDGEHFLCIFPSAVGTTLFRIRLDLSETLQITPDSFNVVSASWSRDGSSIAFRVNGSNNSPNGIYRMNPDGSQITLLHPDDSDDRSAPLWSPDGSQILFTGFFGSLMVLNVALQEVQTIFDFPSVDVDDPRVAAWSPDGARIAFAVTGSGIWLLAPDGTDTTFVAGGGVGAGPSWSPDGSMLAFPVERSEASDLVSRIFVVNADGTGLTQLTADPVEIYDTDPIWHP